jgi:tetratricopeptide (TPR) repeat protein
LSVPRARRRAPASPPAEPGQRLRRLAVAAVLAIATLGAYGAVRGHAFLQFDDAAYVTDNGAVRAGLTWQGLRWAFSTPYAGNWHPLTWLSHMADVQFFGLDPGWHHLSSLLLHVLTVLLLFRLLVRLTGAAGASAFVAALFALHPLHVESVAWIAERKDVLSGLFWVLSMSAYVSYVKRPGAGRMAIVAAAFALALLSKPMAVTLPFALLLLDAWPLGRWRGVSAAAGASSALALVREKAVLFAMAAASAAVTIVVQRQAGAVQSLEAFPLGLRLANVPVAYVKYVLATIAPWQLAPLYPYPSSIPLWESAGAALVLVAASVAVWKARRTRPYLAVGWAWFLGLLVPVIGIIQVGAQPYADRYTYLPSIGLFVMAAWAAREVAAARPEWTRAFATLGIALAAAAAVLTFRQVGVWKDSVTLWQHAAAVTRGNYRAETNLGYALAEAGQRNAALAAYTEAIRLKPDYPNAHNYLGVLLADMGNHDRAVTEYETALTLRPRFAEARNNLGLSHAALGRLDDAIADFREALRIAPTFAPARNNLAIAYINQDRYDEAIAEFEAAVAAQPGSPESQLNLATALASAGRREDALPHFEAAARLGGDPVKVHYLWGGVLVDLGDIAGAANQYMAALSADPAFAPAVHDLGRSLALLGRLDEGIQALQSAAQLDPRNADYHHDLGAALARRGLIPQAIAEMRAALEIDPAHAEAQDALKLLTAKK